jgi:tellurite resistance protein TerC
MSDRFRYLNIGLGVILAFVGVKMLGAEFFHLPSWASLLFISVVLAAAITASVMVDRREEPDSESPDADDGGDGGDGGEDVSHERREPEPALDPPADR